MKLDSSLARVSAGLLLALHAGCSGSGKNNGNTGPGAQRDMTAGADMAVTPDLAVARDLMSPGAATGAPCTKASDCAAGLGKNEPAQCITTDASNLTWPMGYCAALCHLDANDTNTGVNPDCPGDAVTCAGDIPNDTTSGHCRTICAGTADCRTGYACWFVNDTASGGCEPKGESQCDPMKAGSCGMAMNPPDGGAGHAPACEPSGPDSDVGQCADGCDPFAVAGCPGSDSSSDCHILTLTGEGYCDVANTMPAGPGEQCNVDSDCLPGYGCNNGQCWKYCHDDGKTVAAQCGKMTAKCQKLDPMSPVPTSKAGICSTSN